MDLHTAVTLLEANTRLPTGRLYPRPVVEKVLEQMREPAKRTVQFGLPQLMKGEPVPAYIERLKDPPLDMVCGTISLSNSSLKLWC